MKIRDSGMPGQEVWDRFFDATAILERLKIPPERSATVVDFGCGYGTFAVAMAARTCGTIYALDIEPGMISATLERARDSGASNVQVLQRDFVVEGSGLPDCSVDCVLLFNILHADEPLRLLGEAHRILRTAGVVAITTLRRVGRGPGLGLMLLSLAMLEIIQTAIGRLSAEGANLMWIHIPLGVALVGFAAGSVTTARRLGGE